MKLEELLTELDNGLKKSGLGGLARSTVRGKLKPLLDAALAARTEGPTEEEVIAGVVSHWFTQGGKAQFGMIPPCQNADEVVSEILERVRNPKPDSCAVPSATERGKDQA